jgi:serine/threonine protein kinase
MQDLLETPGVQDEVQAWMFFRTLKASRLLPADEIEAWENRVGDGPFEDLARALVEEGVLTPYQLGRIKDGNPHHLVLGQYRVLGELGKGGCGHVYKARHELMDRTVALKMISPEASRSVARRDLFVREVVATTRLLHPNIATAYDANEHDGQLYFAMEYVEGPTLHHLVQTHGPIPVSVVCSYLLQAAEALGHAHERGIVHRDLKPANVMLTHDRPAHELPHQLPNVLKVLDFGLCRLAATKPRLLSTIPCEAGAIVGTPAFIAPEQIRDVHVADARSDLYSLGCTFYYALTGRLPFDGLTTKATLLLHLEYDAPTVAAHRSNIPPGLSAIVARMMAKRPADRYASAADLVRAVNDFVLGGGLGDSGRFECAPRRLAPAVTPLPPSSVPLVVAAPSSEPFVIPPVTVGNPTPRPPDTLIASDQLPLLWGAWADAVTDLAAGRPVTVTATRYKALYRGLIEATQSAGPAGVRVRDLAEPWVSLQSLVRLDPRSLTDLAASVDALDADLTGGAAAYESTGPRLAVAALGLVTLAAAAFGIFKGTGGFTRLPW